MWEDDYILEDELDKLKEECGVFGVFANSELDVSKLSYYALYALQHRGQESAGIAVNDNFNVSYHKDMGLVPEVFSKEIINSLKGKIAVGHVRYSTTGESLRENAQPLVVKYKNGKMALAHNGNLVNVDDMRRSLEEQGIVFQSTNDSEVIANLISRYRLKLNSIEECIIELMKVIKGSYALTILTPQKLIGVRDPLGIRPLCLGKLGESYLLASESCAFDAIGAKLIRDIEPGEVVVISKEGIKSVYFDVNKPSRACIFEMVYFARPDSIIDGQSVHEARLEAGRILAREYPIKADIVIGVPDSGISAALGYAEESKIPYGLGMIKNRYIGRTFIQPDQNQRETAVRIKLNPMKSTIKGKSVILIDDSIVRGTTSKIIVKLLKEAGAKEIHMLLSSSPVRFPCYFGIDTPSRKQLVAAVKTIEEIKELVGADTLGYLSIEGMKSSAKESKCGFCSACFDGDYPVEVPEEGVKNSCG